MAACFQMTTADPVPPVVEIPDFGPFPDQYEFQEDLSKPLPLPAGVTMPETLEGMRVLPTEVKFPNAPAAGKSDPQKTLFETQQAFDVFSWQTFIALNWPADPAHAGEPDPSAMIGKKPLATRVWQSFIPPEDVFKPGGAAPEPYEPTVVKDTGPLAVTKRTHLLNELDEAFFNLEQPLPPIVDTNNEYIRYEVRLNKAEYDFIVTGAHLDGESYPLYSRLGQRRFINKGGSITFPNGCIELKVAWKKIGPGDDHKRFFTREVEVVENPTSSGSTPTKKELYGMIAMHIMYLVEGVPQWVWPTFEHVDNAPISDLRGSTQKIVGEFHLSGAKPFDNWKDGKGGNDAKDYHPLKKRYNLFDPAKAGKDMDLFIGGFSPESREAMMVTNRINNGGPENYYQEKDATKITIPARIPSQITKVITANNDIITSKWTYALNEKMHWMLRNEEAESVWQNYRLVTTQWPSSPGLTKEWQTTLDKWNKANPDNQQLMSSGTIKAGNPAPVSLGNAAAETYMQINGSCMNCHSGATMNFTYPSLEEPYLDTKPDANFSFMLQRAR